MPSRLRRILFSVPVIVTAGLLALYLAGGFFALPAIVKWQIEKQVPEKLGHRISVGAVRFNPLVFRLGVDDLALSDPEGRPMLGFKRLLVDFELRSAIDRAWVFARATLEAPVLHLELAEDGQNNFTPILERLRGTEEPAPEDSGLPRLVVQRVALTDGRIDFSDSLLAEALVARIEPLQIEIDDLSTLPAAAARYRLSARTAAGEALTLAGELGLNPVATKGALALKDLAVATLVRGLSRFVALDSPAGNIRLAASFDVAVDSGGAVSGTVQDVDLNATKLSVAAPGAATPLLAMETLSLGQGRIDFDKREAVFAKLLVAKGRVAAAADEQGGFDWAKIVRASPAAPPEGAAPQTPPATASDDPRSDAAAIAARPWRVAVARTEISEIAVGFSDAASGRRASVAALGIDVASSAEIGPAGMRIELEQPKLSIAGARLEDGADFLDVSGARIEAGRVTMGGEGAATTGAIDDTSIVLTGMAIGESGRSAKLAEVTLDGRRIALRAQAGRVDVDAEKLRSTVASVQMTQAADGLELRAATFASESSSLAQDGGKVRVVAGTPAVSLSALAAHRGDERAAVDELSLAGESITLSSSDDGSLDLTLDAIRTTASALVLNRGADGVEIGTATLGGDSMTLAQADGRLRVAGSGARAAVTGVAARQGSDRIALEDASFDARDMSVATGGDSSGASGVDARLAGAALRLASVGVVAQGASSEVLRLAAANAGADSLVLGNSEGPVALTGEGLTAALSDVVMNSPADATEMARLGSVTLAGGTLHLPERVVTAENLAFANGTARTWIDAQGKFNGLVVIRGLASATAAPPVDPAPAPSDTLAPATPWRLALKSAAVDAFSVAFEDRRTPPALAVGLESIRGRVVDLDTASATPMEVEFQATVASGGEFRTRGKVRLDNGMSDLQVTLAGIALAPVQRYLSDIADLRLASGTVSTEGRLRYGDEAGAGARLAYEGSLAVDRLLLEEVLPERPFLAWDSVATDDVVLTLEPDGVDIGELRVEGPSARLVIAEDHSVNLKDVLKPPQEPGDAPAQQGEPADDRFPVKLARVRVSKGALDFADLSLRPQFRARMHELKGVITGLGTDANASAKLQLDARVDRYGSARIRGRISARDPEKLTDIDMAFRNLEMTSLSPYVAKFAGYRIASGRLALDLKYRVESGKLLGKNKIVLNQVELGEKVESPDALDLPLELAIAILKDADGVIDIGLPVSGDLNDPQFDYGEVIGKAMGNLFGKIVTAPFGALGAMFGGGEKQLDTIDFEPGSDAIAPPERQKLETVARALKERPALRLVVPPTYAPAEDTAALKSLAVRTDIARRIGGELPPGEDPGPIDTANPRVQSAVEAAFSQRYGSEVLADLKRRAVEAAAPAGAPPAPGGPPARQSQPAPDKPAATDAPRATRELPAPPPPFYQRLVDRLIDEAPFAATMLAQLADRRGEAVVRELTTVGGAPAARVVLGERRGATDTDDKVVALRLELEVAK